MRLITMETFAKHWRLWIDKRKGSRVAVLLRWSIDSFENKRQQKFMTELRLECQVKCVQWQRSMNVSEWLEQTEPEYLLVFGDIHMLQDICRSRNDWRIWREDRERRGRDISIVFFSTELLWKDMVRSELLWIREADGTTVYLGKNGWREEDTAVTPMVYEARQKRVLAALSRYTGEWKERSPMNHRSSEEKKQMRYLWHEMAEPLWLRYGVPLWVGILLAVCFLRSLETPEYNKKAVQDPDILQAENERLRRSIWVPAGDVGVLVNMAMAGIEMLPRQERLSWQQVKEFYMQLCRSV